MIYRRRHNSDTWHWRIDCSNWIGHSYAEVKLKKGERPTTGEICNECAAKQNAADAKQLKKRSKK